MPAWSNNDNHASKPKWVAEREVREQYMATVANTTTAGNNTITFTYYDGTASSNLSNVLTVGDSVINNFYGANGYSGFFASNVTVSYITGNTVIFSSNLYTPLPAGQVVEFDMAISRNKSKVLAAGYNANTVLVTPTRLANNSVYMGDITPGWVNINKTTNGGDGAVRYRHETLVALANPTASNTNSGQTGWGTAFTGV